jgi:hypothetical protein
MVVMQRPDSITRSPLKATFTMPPRLEAWYPVNVPLQRLVQDDDDSLCIQ